MIAVLGTMLAAAALLAPSPAEQAAQAEAIAARAVALHADGKLEEASEALARAYEVYPDRDYLYMRGVIERESGDCDTAVRLFTSFVDENPPLVDVEAAQTQLDACEATLVPAVPAVADNAETKADDRSPGTQRPPPPARDAVDVSPTLSRRNEVAPRPWWTDRVGAGLVGTGGALALVGGGLMVGAAVRAQSAQGADTAGEYRQGIDTANRLNTAGGVVLGVATSVILGGVVRWVVIARRDARQPR